MKADRVVIGVLESIMEIISTKMPNRFECLPTSEIDAINNIYVKCKDCLEYIKL